MSGFFFGVGMNDSRLVGRLLSVSQPEFYELTQHELFHDPAYGWPISRNLGLMAAKAPSAPTVKPDIHGRNQVSPLVEQGTG